MRALERFLDWLRDYEFFDRNKKLPSGLRIQYHSRSDEHSKRLGELIVEDLLDICDVIRLHAARGEIAYAINHRFTWPNGKTKTLDLAIGIPGDQRGSPSDSPIRRLSGRGRKRTSPSEYFTRVLIACEEKAVMTEHRKSQPRVYSELNDAHTIVHQGSRDTIAAGITMVNIASSFISPLRQRPDKEIEVSYHNQPEVAASMVDHLRKLPIRETTDKMGLDAYCTFLVNVDNQGHVDLHTAPPAPQPGDPDHYETFLQRICRFYDVRYRDLHHLPEDSGLSAEESLVRLAHSYPGLLDAAGQLAVDRQLAGASELLAILRSIERQANHKGRTRVKLASAAPQKRR